MLCVFGGSYQAAQQGDFKEPRLSYTNRQRCSTVWYKRLSEIAPAPGELVKGPDFGCLGQPQAGDFSQQNSSSEL